MSKASAAEWLLARITDPARAAAILGDLTEMAITRGRLWFWTAYARTLFSLTRRIVLAFFAAAVCRLLIFNLCNLYFQVTPPTWRTSDAPHLFNSMGPLLASVTSTLWFALPFAAILYGVRDRFVQLTFSVALGTTVAFLFIPFASIVCAAATLAIAVAALLSSTWRKPAEVLAWTAAAGIIALAAHYSFTAAAYFRLTVHPQAGIERILINYGVMLTLHASLFAVAIVCSRLHTRLLRPPIEGGVHA